MSAPVVITSTFAEIFGEQRNPLPREQRRERWARWLRLGRAHGARDMVRSWQGNECGDCRHRQGRNWCDAQELPCTVNPLVTYRTGLIGMACMGFGHEPRS